MNNFKKITTARLSLRELKNKDIYNFSELFNDNETMSLFGGSALSDDLDLNNIINRYRKEFEKNESIFWVITLTEEKEFIGFIRMMNYSSFYFESNYNSLGNYKNSNEFQNIIDNIKGWEVDYALLNEYRKKGVMSEALSSIIDFSNQQNINPIYAKVDDLTNIPTIKVLLKNNFTEHLPILNSQGIPGMIYKYSI